MMIIKGFRYLAKEKVSKLPKTPGVYALVSPKETLYIGKAANLRERIKNHFHKSSYRDNLFIDKVDRVGFLETQSEIDALLLESRLIKEHQPKYNIMWRDDKGYFFVGITKEQFPRVFLTHQPQARSTKSTPSSDGVPSRMTGQIPSTKSQTNSKSQNTKYQILNTRYIGPFVDGRALKQVLRMLRRAFPYYTQKKHGPLLCSWCHLGLCPGPTPNAKEYRKNIRNLVSFLEGRQTSVLKNLKKAMANAARKERFEEASRLRDQVFAMENVMFHSLVSSPLEGNSPLPSPLPKPWRNFKRIEAYDISNIQGKFATGSMVTFLEGKPAKEWYRKFKIHPVIRQGAPSDDGAHPNDYAMMEELISRRLKHPEWPYPDLMLIDGGKAQLSAALKAMQKSKIPPSPLRLRSGLRRASKIQKYKSKIKIATLAKRHNELFLPNRKKPILLKDLPQHAQHLFLHLRDEAHRFAISYHRKLRRVDLFPQN